MARTIRLFAPALYTLRLYSAAGSLTQTVTLAEVHPGLYAGTLTAPAGTYTAVVLDGDEIRGAFEGVAVSGDDPEVVTVRDKVNISAQLDLEGIEVTAEVDAAAIAAAVWANAQRTLTMPAASLPAVQSGSALTLRRGDTLLLAFTGLGSLAERRKAWWTLKSTRDRYDASAQLQVEESEGLLYAAGEAVAEADAGDGAITVTDEETGALAVRVEAWATALLAAGSYVWDLQVLEADGTVRTLSDGTATVVGDVTRATE